MKDHHEGRKKIGKFEPHEEPNTELLADKDENYKGMLKRPF